MPNTSLYLTISMVIKDFDHTNVGMPTWLLLDIDLVVVESASYT